MQLGCGSITTMNEVDSILQTLRENGFRITTTRESILRFLEKQEAPTNAKEILAHLKKKKLSVNKTTVYREIHFLYEHGYIQEVFVDHGIRYIELAHKDHHHHIRCSNCGDMRDIEVQAAISNDIQRIQKKTKFTITDHIIEFIGLCPSCKK